jgi:hypothetical protein
MADERMPNYYEYLEVAADCTEQDLLAALRRAAATPVEPNWVKGARFNLADPRRRRAYDRLLLSSPPRPAHAEVTPGIQAVVPRTPLERQEVLVFGGDPDRDWPRLAAMVAGPAEAVSRPVLIVNLAGDRTRERLREELYRSAAPATWVVDSAGTGSTVPGLFGPAHEIVRVIVRLVMVSDPAIAEGKIRRQLNAVKDALGEELAISARPVTAISTVLDIAAGINDGAGGDAFQEAVRQVRVRFGGKEAADLWELADLVRPLREFEANASPAAPPGWLRILNLREDHAGPAEKARGRAIVARYLQARLAVPEAGAAVVIDAGRLDATPWPVTSPGDPGTLLVSIFRNFAGQEDRTGSAQVPHLMFFRLAGADAEDASRFLGSEELWREVSTTRTNMRGEIENSGNTVTLSFRPSFGTTQSNGRSSTRSEAAVTQLVKKPRVEPETLAALRDREFILLERKPDGPDLSGGRLLSFGGGR